MQFKVESKLTPSGDQPLAIEEIANRLNNGEKDIVLEGATGTGKTATTAWLVEKINRPTLIIEPNKTLAAQLCAELRELMPNNAIEYFVSYYDYYQPEAYIAQSDTYIEKDSSINDEIEKLRHHATVSLLSRRDVIVVASVSCIYGLGEPKEYIDMILDLKVGQEIDRSSLITSLVKSQYSRNDFLNERGDFRVKGDVIEIVPVYEENPIRIELFGDEIERITILHPVTFEIQDEPNSIKIFPASHYVSSDETLKRAIKEIENELEITEKDFKKQNKLIEAQRIQMRTKYDLDMLRETGTCRGVENYSRLFDGRKEGEPPSTLIDFFPDDFLLVVDESHITIPQIGAMYHGDQSRKRSLVDFGFRLPSAKDNRPLNFEEFLQKIGQSVYLSATPGDYELDLVKQDTVKQIIRPTGLIDPKIEVRPSSNQIEDILLEINKRVEKKERILITTLTKRMAEDLTNYLLEKYIKVEYLHSDVETIKRVQLLRELRQGKFDVLVGINLLREGLDLPEVSLVCILDADKQGFLRSYRSLIQTIGRAARNIDGTVLMYGDKITPQMKDAIDETDRRRNAQIKYNKEHNITPQALQKKISDVQDLLDSLELDGVNTNSLKNVSKDNIHTLIPQRNMTKENLKDEIIEEIKVYKNLMLKAADDLNFELAAELRDRVSDLNKEIKDLT